MWAAEQANEIESDRSSGPFRACCQRRIRDFCSCDGSRSWSPDRSAVSRCDSSLHCHVRIWQNRTVRYAPIPVRDGNSVLKHCSYLFLVERVHIVRAPFAHRFRDPVWVFGVLITVGGLGSIVGVEYIAPRSSISPGDGQCQMGIVPKTAIAIMAFDMGIGAILTGIFVWIMRSSFWPVGSMAMQPTSASDHDRRSGQRRWSRRLTRCSSRSGLGEER